MAGVAVLGDHYRMLAEKTERSGDISHGYSPCVSYTQSSYLISCTAIAHRSLGAAAAAALAGETLFTI